MKKFSTAALILALTAFAGVSAAANDGPQAARRCAFLPNAPDQHVVVRGDTLWDISGKFLEHAWCWPQVWGLNKEEIRNPHLIYPGQIVYFDRAAGKLRLGSSVGAGASSQTERLSPRIRTEGVGIDAIPAVPANVIEPFLSQPLIVTEDELNGAPRIMATDGGRVILGKNDIAFVRGELDEHTAFQVFRPGTPLRDPDTKEVIGYEAAYLGDVKLERAAQESNEAHLFRVVNVKQEIGIGDRLLPLPPATLLSYVPHPPEQEIQARVASIYGGVSQAGQNQIVTVNRGSSDGVDIGTVLELYRHGGMVADPTEKSSGWFKKNEVKLPDIQYGSLFIFRVFDHVSYGLVMQVRDSVQIGDSARSPQ